MEMFEEHQIENYYHHHLRDGLVEEGGSTRSGGGVCAVVADMMDMESLCVAFHGCSCVFHTSAFIDPTGVSGYSPAFGDKTDLLTITMLMRTAGVMKLFAEIGRLVLVIRDLNRLPHNYHVDETLSLKIHKIVRRMGNLHYKINVGSMMAKVPVGCNLASFRAFEWCWHLPLCGPLVIGIT